MNKTESFAFAIIFASFVISFYFYPIMPDPMPSHWNASGVVDGYMPKAIALFLMPVISLIFFVLFIKIPNIDPLKQNVKSFRKYYDYFILLLILFLFYIYLLMILWSLDIKFNIIFVLVPAFSVLFFYVGILCEKSKQNWFIGIKTPWTLSNETVWNKTHKLGGKLFKICAIISLAGLLFGDYAIWFAFVPILFGVIYAVWYSYKEYKILEKKK